MCLDVSIFALTAPIPTSFRLTPTIGTPGIGAIILFEPPMREPPCGICCPCRKGPSFDDSTAQPHHLKYRCSGRVKLLNKGANELGYSGAILSTFTQHR